MVEEHGSLGVRPSVFCTVGLLMVFVPGHQTEISDCLLYKKRLGNDDKASLMCLPSAATYLCESSLNVLLVGMCREGTN
jgi:hypothetical protein